MDTDECSMDQELSTELLADAAATKQHMQMRGDTGSVSYPKIGKVLIINYNNSLSYTLGISNGM